jgi:acyl-CoA thioesterase
VLRILCAIAAVRRLGAAFDLDEVEHARKIKHEKVLMEAGKSKETVHDPSQATPVINLPRQAMTRSNVGATKKRKVPTPQDMNPFSSEDPLSAEEQMHKMVGWVKILNLQFNKHVCAIHCFVMTCTCVCSILMH